jgi:hypothetical protein
MAPLPPAAQPPPGRSGASACPLQSAFGVGGVDGLASLVLSGSAPLVEALTQGTPGASPLDRACGLFDGSNVRGAAAAAPATAVAAAAAAAPSVPQRLGPQSLPLLAPPLDLMGGEHVRGKVASAWMASYGEESDRLARRVEKWQKKMARLERRQRARAASGGGRDSSDAETDLDSDDAEGRDEGGRGRVAASVVTAGAANTPPRMPRPFTPLQSLLWGPLNHYCDVYFAARTHRNARELRTLLALHVANHALKAREAVQRHDQRIKEAATTRRVAKLARTVDAAAGTKGARGGAAGPAAGGGQSLLEMLEERARKEAAGPDTAQAEAQGDAPGRRGARRSGGAEAGMEGDAEFRDQGFTRPRVLVLLPFRNAALAFVRSLLRLFPGRQVFNINRFFREFSEEGSGLGAECEEDEEDEAARKAELKRLAELGDKGAAEAAVIATASRRRRQMMSDVEDGESSGAEDEDENGATGVGEGGATSGPSASDLALLTQALTRDTLLGAGSAASATSAKGYLFNSGRQGWTGDMLSRLKRLKDKGALLTGAAASAAAIDLNEATDLDATEREWLKALSGAAEADEDKQADEAEREAYLATLLAGSRSTSALAVTSGRKKVDDSILGKNRGAVLNAKGRMAALEKQMRREQRKVEERERELLLRKQKSLPLDYRLTFTGNIDDDFKCGIALNRKGVRLYADFYDCDIIVASPLGIRRIIGGEGENEKRRDFDFLSSIEVVALDGGAEVMGLQNWDHVLNIFSVLNKTPIRQRDTDFTRVREWNLAGWAKYYRQTICFSSYLDLDVNFVMRSRCFNTQGSLVVRGTYTGTISRVVPAVKQNFQKILSDSLAAADDARFAYFRDTVLPELQAGVNADTGAVLSHTIIYIPSYFDYVRLRNLLDQKEMEFASCSEYSEDVDVSMARKAFARGEFPILLYTERFHFFRRLRLKGVRHVIFYSPPSVPHFYPEMLNLLEGAGSRGEPISATCLFSSYDALALERVVGTDRASRMIADNTRSTFFFV